MFLNKVNNNSKQTNKLKFIKAIKDQLSKIEQAFSLEFKQITYDTL